VAVGPPPAPWQIAGCESEGRCAISHLSSCEPALPGRLAKPGDRPEPTGYEGTRVGSGPAGRLATHKRALLVMIAAAALAAVVAAPGEARAGEPRAAAAKPFGSCTALVGYARRHALRHRSALVRPMDLGGDDDAAEPLSGGRQDSPAEVEPPVAGEDFSTTNVQEVGVDEPDSVKTDGRRLFAVADGRIEAVDVRGATPLALGSLKLDDAASEHELLLLGDRLLVISRQWARLVPRTLLREVDVADPTRMRTVRTLVMDGSYVSARLTGGTVRVVVTSQPRALTSVRRVRRARSAGWLPRAVVTRSAGARPQQRRLVSCRAVRRTATFSGLGVVTVVTLSLSDGLQQLDADALMSDAETVYASTQSAYVATTRWDEPAARTTIHRFDTSQPATTEYRATGSVPGDLLSQWALSEHAGHLRVASTEQRRDSESRVTVLREHEGRLVEVGRVDGLGRGERIEGVRFAGAVGYVVTFRQIDPLYTLDLADPTAPKVLGELKIPGYSDYLHPLDENLLLGVGQDATFDGEAKGTQVSLFDVSDLRNPRRVSNLALGWQYRSAVEEDHRAFLYWPQAGLVVLPIERWRDADDLRWAGAGAFRVAGGALTEAGRLGHPVKAERGHITRSLVAAERLLTVSEAGVMSSPLASPGPGAWLAFRPG
jgi:uncharacterized secreted protein with C-terminal beta-propeller domain